MGGDGLRPVTAGRAPSAAVALTMEGLRSWLRGCCICGDGGDLVLLTLASGADANEDSLVWRTLLLPLADHKKNRNMTINKSKQKKKKRWDVATGDEWMALMSQTSDIGYFLSFFDLRKKVRGKMDRCWALGWRRKMLSNTNITGIYKKKIKSRIRRRNAYKS